MGSKLDKTQEPHLSKFQIILLAKGQPKGDTDPEEDVTAQKFTNPEINEEHFIKDPMQIEIAEELKRVSEKVNSEDFKILRVLGRGAFGKIVLVQHKEGGALYALKTLRKSKIIKMLQVEHTKSERT
jgi:serine/threonine protein kinase